MIELNSDEARVLGVLIEKSLTTPEQYPLTLNSTVNGCNQKNNRDPVVSMTEDQVHDALDCLRKKGLVVRVDIVGNRVPKYRQEAVQVLHMRQGELAILAELLLRGPQTLGELRGRASRMHPMESLEAARDNLRALMDRTEPLVAEVAPPPGTRAEKYANLLCPDNPIAVEAVAATAAPVGTVSDALPDRVAKLEARVEALGEQLRSLAEALGHDLESPRV